MKTLILSLILFLGFATFSLAQDQIITIKGDTFECKITKIDDRFIHFIMPLVIQPDPL